MTALKNQAIQTALNGNWKEAISLNQAILEENPEDVDALNRLAYAFSSLGDLKQAKNLYQKVLTMDAHNPIATRNVKRLNGNGNLKSNQGIALSLSNLFIEEPGKTKIVELINIADKKTVTQLRCGEKIDLNVKRMRIFVYDNQKQFIGMLPDDLSRRLIKFIEAGNEYEAYVKDLDNNRVVVFIHEVKRANRFKNQSSFLSPEKTKLRVKSFDEEKSSHVSSSPDKDEE